MKWLRRIRGGQGKRGRVWKRHGAVLLVVTAWLVQGVGYWVVTSLPHAGAADRLDDPPRGDGLFQMIASERERIKEQIRAAQEAKKAAGGGEARRERDVDRGGLGASGT